MNVLDERFEKLAGRVGATFGVGMVGIAVTMILQVYLWQNYETVESLLRLVEVLFGATVVVMGLMVADAVNRYKRRVDDGN